MLNRLAMTVLLLVVLAGATAAQASETQDREDIDTYARIQLAAANAPGDLLSDAYLVPMIDLTLEVDHGRQELDPALREALVQARDDLSGRIALAEEEAPVALFTTVSCLKKGADAQKCDGARERLAELANDNGYHHFVLMSMAAKRGDDEAFAVHGQKAVEAPNFEPDFVPVFASLHARYSKVPDELWQQKGIEHGPEAAPGILAMAVAAAVVLPGYQPFVKACDGDSEARRLLCVAVARRMAERSTVLLDRLIGVGLLKKFGTPAEQEAARELEREANWLHAGMAAFDSELDDSQTGRYFDIFASEGEFAALRYAANVTGRSLEPPADWQR